MRRNKNITEKVFVDLNSCDGCGSCAEVCPSHVFEMKTLTDKQRSNLNFKGKLKVRVKGDLRSNIINADACIGCGKCVRLCHEHAIVVKDLSKRA